MRLRRPLVIACLVLATLLALGVFQAFGAGFILRVLVPRTTTTVTSQTTIVTGQSRGAPTESTVVPTSTTVEGVARGGPATATVAPSVATVSGIERGRPSTGSVAPLIATVAGTEQSSTPTEESVSLSTQTVSPIDTTVSRSLGMVDVTSSTQAVSSTDTTVQRSLGTVQVGATDAAVTPTTASVQLALGTVGVTRSTSVVEPSTEAIAPEPPPPVRPGQADIWVRVAAPERTHAIWEDFDVWVTVGNRGDVPTHDVVLFVKTCYPDSPRRPVIRIKYLPPPELPGIDFSVVPNAVGIDDDCNVIPVWFGVIPPGPPQIFSFRAEPAAAANQHINFTAELWQSAPNEFVQTGDVQFIVESALFATLAGGYGQARLARSDLLPMTAPDFAEELKQWLAANWERLRFSSHQCSIASAAVVNIVRVEVNDELADLLCQGVLEASTEYLHNLGGEGESPTYRWIKTRAPGSNISTPAPSTLTAYADLTPYPADAPKGPLGDGVDACISSPFGPRVPPTPVSSDFHNGIDIVGPGRGAPIQFSEVKANIDGYIRVAGYDFPKDDDEDGQVDEDPKGDANKDGFPGVKGIDDDGDTLIDEDSSGRQPGDVGYSNDLKGDDDEDGQVDEDPKTGSLGERVWISEQPPPEPGGVWHVYGHLFAISSAVRASVGQPIQKGTTIGLVGSSGTSTAPHLHYGVFTQGQGIGPENPLNFSHTSYPLRKNGHCATITISKLDAETEQLLSGACFFIVPAVKKLDSGVFVSSICDQGSNDSNGEHGKIQIFHAEPGTYSVLEDTPPPDYDKDPDAQGCDLQGIIHCELEFRNLQQDVCAVTPSSSELVAAGLVEGCEGPPGDATCSDGIDNDEDGLKDQKDPSCQEPEGPPGDPTCTDGIDNDGNGLPDLADEDCQGWEGPPGHPICADGHDNDFDGLVDLADPGCLEPEGPPGDPTCSDDRDNDDDGLTDLADGGCLEPEGPLGDATCVDGVDNDGDGPIDEADQGCQPPEGPPGDPTCSDDIDNDGDDLTDGDDSGCQEAEGQRGHPSCSDGVDNDGDGLIDEADPGCRGEGPPGDRTCSDGIDNDLDGSVDESDTGCRGAEGPCCPLPLNCFDGIDNDGDGDWDLEDRDCSPQCIPPDCDPPPPPGCQGGCIKDKDNDETITTGAIDPNLKVNSGFGPQGFVAPGQDLSFVIHFENLQSATAEAVNIVVTDKLDPALDFNTLSIGPVSHPEVMDAQFNHSTGLITWTFTNINLPPNQNPPEGEGSVFYTVRPKPGLPSGAEIRNTASIVFDFNEPVVTNETLNTIDGDLPSSQVNALPAQQSDPNFEVTWSGDDGAGSGIREYDVYFLEDNGPFVPWFYNTTESSAIFPGEPGRTYAFFSIARDNVGNVEDPPAGPDAQTTVVLDATPPAITPSQSPPTNAAGWNNTDVEVSWSVTDPESGVASSSGCDTTILSVETPGATLTCSATNGAGLSSSASTTVRIDKTPPSTSKTLVDSDNDGLVEGLDLAASDPGALSGVREIKVSIDGGPLQTFAGDAATLGPFSTPTVEASFFAVDNADNSEPPSVQQHQADACPLSAGQYQGCPVGDANLVELHVINQDGDKTRCDPPAGSCKSPITGAEVKVFDRNKLNGLTITTLDAAQAALTKNPDGSLYDDIYESVEANASALAAPFGCVTTDGSCIAGEESTGDYLVILKYVDTDTGKNVYTGKPKSGSDFVDTNSDGLDDLASKDFQVIKVFKRDGTIQFSGGKKTVVNGSYLEIVYPDHAIWEDVAAGYVYPFIFISDSDWTVDVCAQVPQGYAIVGVYDEQGNLLSGESCSQTFVSGETKVVAFDVVEVGSPEPVLDAALSVSHEGKVTEVDIEIPGVRSYADEAGRAGAQSTIVWSLVAAALGGVALLIGVTVWRRRRA